MPRPRIGSSEAANSDSWTLRSRAAAAVSRSAGCSTSVAIVCARAVPLACARSSCSWFGDLLAHFVEGLDGFFCLLDDLDDVKAERGPHEVADRTRRQRERGLFKLWNHLPSAEGVEVAAALGGGLVFGVPPGQFGEIGAGLGLCKNFFGPRSNSRLILALGPQQDVTSPYPARANVYSPMLVL